MSALLLLGLRLLAALLLYAFVGLALYLMWRTLQSQTDLLSSNKRTPLRLSLLQNSLEQILEVQQNEILIGRDPDCQVCIDDAAVSARHARLFFRHGHWWVEDAGSKNGTLLNDMPLTMPAILANGDTLVCGNSIINILLPE